MKAAKQINATDAVHYQRKASELFVATKRLEKVVEALVKHQTNVSPEAFRLAGELQRQLEKSRYVARAQVRALAGTWDAISDDNTEVTCFWHDGQVGVTVNLAGMGVMQYYDSRPRVSNGQYIHGALEAIIDGNV